MALRKKIKNPVEVLRKKCVEVAKKINKIESKYTCQYCGVGKPQRQVHSHHIFSEGAYKSMSADTNNLICVCAIHHTGGMWGKSNDNFAFHLTPAEAMQWYRDNYEDNYQVLLKRTRELKQMGEYEWNLKLIELKRELEEIIEKYK